MTRLPPSFVKGFLQVVLFCGIIFLIASMFQSVAMVEQAKRDAQEGSGTCYRAAGEHPTDPSIRAMAADHKLTRGECRKIYDLIDDIGREQNFEARKLDALKKLTEG